MKVLCPKDTNALRSASNKNLKIDKKRFNGSGRKQPIRLPQVSGNVDGSPVARSPRKSEVASAGLSLAPAAGERESLDSALSLTPHHVNSDSLTQQALDQLQYTICEREMDIVSCGHPFCHRLRSVKLPLSEFRNLFLFDLEMIPDQFRSQMTNLRNCCYSSQIYRDIYSDWKILSTDNQGENNKGFEKFDCSQLWIGAPARAVSTVQDLSGSHTSDRVRSRRRAMPGSFLATRNQVAVFEEPVNPSELLKDSSSLSSSTDGKPVEHCRLYRHNN
ncbi:LADA_0H09164g1_1 [Lachancea dasiensis]|uniref:LADA_0H09164g1_1 n=1 Tax=Lachancea dasiensis TaxID=1072105 RepID=A0A1G4K2S8_9SACH|nr:LADA_0H09164g1_1 [Lachancea dasiensis]